MIKKEYIFLAFMLISFILIPIPFVFATQTPITIITEPNVNVSVNIIDMSSEGGIATLDANTDAGGRASLVFDNSFSGRMGLSILVRKEGRLIMPLVKKLDSYVPGNSITVDLTVKNQTNATSIQNITQNNTQNITQNNSQIIAQTNTSTAQQNASQTAENATETAENDKLSSLVIFENKNIIRVAVYIIIGLVILGAIIMLIIKGTAYIKDLRLKRAELRSYDKPLINEKEVEKELEKAKKKIMEAQTEIDSIKNKRNRMQEAEKRFEEAKRELEKLKSGKI